ncbi:copper amine oxidase [Alkalihalobacillus macyae]|uniref:copper amine oxidase n=1 Tax=Guptibacillus hwajinpoensis TaxID=208199 RepID=UPI00273C1492|nr:copper amine oxidase [Alkalihalobacillus macyae]MDP4552223.1 copper amine oxidase [Alkalihalobacillus macyae]
MKLKRAFKKLMVPALGLTLLFPSVAGAADAEPTVNTPAADLRATLDQLLSEHFVLAVTSMTKSYDGAADAEEVTEALDQNAADMTPAIASVYGEEAAQQFEDIFRGHNDYSSDFVQAAKEDNDELRKEAEMEVDEFVDEFSTFLDTATEGNLPKEAAEEALELHEDQVLTTFDEYTEGNYEQAYTTFRAGHKHMFAISKALSNAIVMQMPDKFENTRVDTPAAELRSTLNSLASEHFALSSLGLEKGYDQSEDYDFVNWAEDRNTADFKAAIGSIYGGEAASQFEKIWQEDHIAAQADLVVASLSKDEESMNMAKEQLLETFPKNFGAFLGTATEENLPADAATEALMTHEKQVVGSFESYMSGDYKASTDQFREGYAFMFGVGESLGGAIVKQMPDKFAGESMPGGMPKTGMGGASEQSSDLTALWITIGSLAVAGSAFAIRRKVINH